jgi:hypothetical protein
VATNLVPVVVANVVPVFFTNLVLVPVTNLVGKAEVEATIETTGSILTHLLQFAGAPAKKPAKNPMNSRVVP